MQIRELQNKLSEYKSKGRKIAVCFCCHVPQEILAAAGFITLRISHVEDVKPAPYCGLPTNVCPIVKELYELIEGGVLKDADLIIADTSCDGKKKMYELVSAKDKLYYYQVPQGEDRAYVKPLIVSEYRHLIRFLEKKFGIRISEEEIRRQALLANEERDAVNRLMDLQKVPAPAVFGSEIYRKLMKAQTLFEPAQRLAFLTAAYEELSVRRASVAGKYTKRVILTGCPLGGAHQMIFNAIEENGGLVVAIENCEALKASRRRFDPQVPDVIEGLAECYRNTACAIMSPNRGRFALIEELARSFDAHCVIDVALTTCHPYTVERTRMKRFCDALDLPYAALDTDFTGSDSGRINTRIAALLEML